MASGERQKFDQVIIGSRKWADVLGRLDCNPEEKFCLSSVQYNSRYVCLCSVQPQNLDDWILPNTVAHFQVFFPNHIKIQSQNNIIQKNLRGEHQQTNNRKIKIGLGSPQWFLAFLLQMFSKLLPMGMVLSQFILLLPLSFFGILYFCLHFFFLSMC